MLNRGLVHLYLGDGKGKTSAAVGQAVRACGHGLRVLMCRFLKGTPSGEVQPLKAMGVRVLSAKQCTKFLSELTEGELCREQTLHTACLRQAYDAVMAGEVDVLVLDEVTDAVEAGLIPLRQLLQLLETRPGYVEVVMTGHKADDELIRAADYHTQMTCLAHPYLKGTTARAGIEF